MHRSSSWARQLLQTLPLCSSSVTQTRSVFLTFGRMEEAMQHLQSNPFYDKYAAKINKVKEQHPSALVSAVSARRAEVQTEASDPLAAAAGVKPISSKAKQAKTPLPKRAYDGVPQKKLERLMKLELLQDKSAEDVAYVWTQYWRQQPVISGVMKADQYSAIFDTAARYDKFLFPLPREQGYEFILAQFTPYEVHFTPLINYQAYQENAPECLTMVHYTELKDKLGIVLMRGEYDDKIISGKEAQFLANQVQLYYNGQDTSKMAVLRRFHEDPASFSHMDLVKELEQLDLTSVASNSKAAS